MGCISRRGGGGEQIVFVNSKPDYENVMRRRKTVYKKYTYDELSEKRKNVGDDAFYKNWITQWFEWKRGNGWEGEEIEDKDYFDLLTDVELYFHTRRFLRDCICMSCAYCCVQSFWKWTDIKNHPCLERMDEERAANIQTVKSPEGKSTLIARCPVYTKKDDRRLYYEYIESPLWHEIRNQIIASSPYCEGCGKSENEVKLVAHHKSYNNLCFEDETGDCAVMCGECHMEIHRDPEAYWDKYSTIIPAHKRKEAQND